jgi:GAF domain-containing protein
MLAPAMPHNEAARVLTLARMDLIGAERDERCQRYARVARALAGTSIAAVSIVGPGDQWFRGNEGLLVDGTSRRVSFCAHAIHEQGHFQVQDAHLDVRFADNPLVTGSPHIRFYAGFPIRVPGDLALGTLCVIDSQPRSLTQEQIRALRDLADCLQSEMTTLLSVADMNDVAKELFELLPCQNGARSFVL